MEKSPVETRGARQHNSVRATLLRTITKTTTYRSIFFEMIKPKYRVEIITNQFVTYSEWITDYTKAYDLLQSLKTKGVECNLQEDIDGDGGPDDDLENIWA